MKVVFHVGYPKCGSTTLQRHLFAARGGLIDLSANAYPSDSLAARLVAHLTNGIISTDEGGFERAQKIWSEDIINWMKSTFVNVFSSEHLVIGEASADIVFSRLASLHDDSHVMFVIRRQHEIIRSLSVVYPVVDRAERASGRSVPLTDYAHAILERDTPFPADTFRIAARIDEAKAHFGEKRVHVFRFDGLFRTGEDIGRLADLLEIDVSDVSNALTTPPANDYAPYAARRQLRLLLGPIRGSWFLSREKLVLLNRWLAPFLGVKRTEMPSTLVERIKVFYAKDNARLAELVPEVERLS